MSETGGLITGMSISHETATLDQLDGASFTSSRETARELAARPDVHEAFVLQTCNRIEAYVVTDDADRGRAVLRSLFEESLHPVTISLGHEESLRHLLRVAAGLESLVLGEDQILGQVRESYEAARTVDAIGPVLEEGVTKAIRVGERARTETAINEGVVSLASAAVRLTRESHGLDGATGLVVGAGEMGALAAKRLAPHVTELRIANRTESRATAIADRVQEDVATVRTLGLSAVSNVLPDTDVVVSATGSPEPVLDRSDFADVGETFVVDIARPRDVSPAVADLDEVTVYDLDRLEGVTEKTRQLRRSAAERVETIVQDEFEQLLVQYKRKRADSVISAMYEGAERVKARELEMAFEKLDLGAEGEAVVESMADAIVSQLLAAPTTSLRDAAEDDDWSTIHTALCLFDPQFEGGSPPTHVEGLQPEELPPTFREALTRTASEQGDD